ncbi:hypothetical protein DSO57_1020278 [Entomophthora muscae]|uniref:Uncharacterized protein n=1 Tax=Entomophthora muscae TaxID=34485 RepID=A0ACC2S5W5_9FUNG|nr:hypothetical protein DSO57_1020278 [Entomophthora muscae]
MACLSRENSDADHTPDRDTDTYQINLTICTSKINFNPACFISHSPDNDWRPRPPPKRTPSEMHHEAHLYPSPVPRPKPLGPRLHEPLVKTHSAPPRIKPSGPRAFDARRKSFSRRHESSSHPSDVKFYRSRLCSLSAPTICSSFYLIRPLQFSSPSPRRQLLRLYNAPTPKSSPATPTPPAGFSLAHRNSNPTPAPNDYVDPRPLRSFLPSKPHTVGNLINKVKAHTAQKLPLGASVEGGAPDRRLTKALASLKFVQHIAQIELSEIKQATPWFLKLGGSADNSPLPSPTTCPDPPTSSPQEERKEPVCNEAARRWHLACEITDTEASYLKHLQTTLELFRDPLLVAPCPIPANAILGIFGHHERLVALADSVKAALSTITHRDAWDPLTSCIGPVFLSRNRFFRAYLDYIQGYLAAVDLVQRYESSSLAFRSILAKGTAANPARQTLKEMLILPVQRLARYSLLLQTLRRLTPDSHPDRSLLAETVDQMSALALEANEALRAKEESAAARAIYASVDNCPTMLRNAGFKQVFMSEAQELRSRRRLRLFVYPGFIMVTVTRRQWGIHQSGHSPKPARPKWKFLHLLPLAQLDLVEVVEGSHQTEVCLLVYSPEPPSPPHFPLRYADRSPSRRLPLLPPATH